MQVVAANRLTVETYKYILIVDEVDMEMTMEHGDDANHSDMKECVTGAENNDITKRGVNSHMDITYINRVHARHKPR